MVEGRLGLDPASPGSRDFVILITASRSKPRDGYVKAESCKLCVCVEPVF